MNGISKSLSIVAFYFSEYNVEALRKLGYATYTKAFRDISILLGRDNNYLKLRRDEFDALPESRSTRKGWRNRSPVKDVVDMAAYLRNFSFEEMTELVRSLLANAESPYDETNHIEGNIVLPENIEDVINKNDTSAGIKIKISEQKIRKYDSKIIYQLKHLYLNRCQICGSCCGEPYGSHIAHAHHIDYFSKSFNNNADNIMILCPNHHGIIHDTNPQFVRNDLTYHSPNGYVERLAFNMHL